MEALTEIAAQLLRENWSIVEDLFRAVATVHHLKKRSPPGDSSHSNSKRICMPRTPPQPPEPESYDSVV